MPGILKVRVSEARDLPVMDRSTELTDAYVEVKFADESYKTPVCKKTLSPVWNTDFRFELEDEELQDDTLEIKVWDQDTISSDDAIGKVLIDLNPLLNPDGPSQIAGWLPIFDTLRGIRGEIYVSVKLDLISDANKFRDTSLGVRFFAMPSLPPFYRTLAIHGFVEELIVNDDPEHQFIDNFRTQRTSNEARQTLFAHLAGELRRKLGLKVLEMGGNAVVGYQQYFDFEREFGIVARAIGTACRLGKHSDAAAEKSSLDHAPVSPLTSPVGSPSVSGTYLESAAGTGGDSSSSVLGSSASDGGGGGGGGLSTKLPPSMGMQRHVHAQQELPLITLTQLPKDVIQSIGGVVASRSVKLLDKINNPDEPLTRDKWWIEVREEIRSHARTLGCNAVIGYTETSTICGELCLLSGTGTAVTLNLSALSSRFSGFPTDDDASERAAPETLDLTGGSSSRQSSLDESGNVGKRGRQHRRRNKPCTVCHIPFRKDSIPFPMRLVKCALCKRRYVPEVLFATIEPPTEIAISGQGCLIEARICRLKKKAQGEAHATILSESTPFVEYDLHRQLLYKLKLRGLNALFGLRTQITVGESLIVGVATATAVFLPALPAPPSLQITRTIDGVDVSSDSQLSKKLKSMNTRARPDLTASASGVSDLDSDSGSSGSSSESDDEGSSPSELGEQTAFVVEVDDETDVDTMAVLFDPPLPEGFFMCTTQILPPYALASPTSFASAFFGGGQMSASHVSMQWLLSSISPYTIQQVVYQQLASHDAQQQQQQQQQAPASPPFHHQQQQLQPQQSFVSDSPSPPQQQKASALSPLAPSSSQPSVLMTPSFTVQSLTVMRRESIGERRYPNQQIAAMFHSLQASLWYKLRHVGPCCLTNIKYDVQVPEDDIIEITLFAMVQSLRPVHEQKYMQHLISLALHSQGGSLARDVDDGASSGSQPSTPSISAIPTPLSKLFLKARNKKQLFPGASGDEDPLMFPMDAPESVKSSAASSAFASSVTSPAAGSGNFMSFSGASFSSESAASSSVPRTPNKSSVSASSPFAAAVFSGDGASAKSSVGHTGHQQQQQQQQHHHHHHHHHHHQSLNMPSGWIAGSVLPDAQKSLARHLIEITSLCYIANAHLERSLGHISLFLIKESSSVREDGGTSAFIQRFIMEAHAMARAQVAALGGNALVSYNLTQNVFLDRNQSYLWLNITGDVVEVSRLGERDSGLHFVGTRFKSH